MSGNLRVLVLIREAPDAAEAIRIRDGAVDLSSLKLVIDTMDEYGVEQALRLKEAGQSAETVVLAVGPEASREALRAALAMGADRAIHVLVESPLDPIALSQVVAVIAREEQASLIFTGGQQADWDSQALGAATAERLGWPQLSWTKKLAVENGVATGERDLDEGSESFRVPVPVVVTTQQGLNEPRYPTVPNIMKAAKKELRRENLDRFGAASTIRILASRIETKPRQGRILDGMDEESARSAAFAMAELLRREAGVA